MANTTISPNMNLPVPTVGVDPGPDWATNVVGCFSGVDSHNHTAGQGVAITPAAININTDLPLNGNNLISVRATRYNSQTVAPSDPGDLNETTVISGDLYYIDGSGNVIRLTQSGAPSGATGTITGLPSGTASASFSGTTFVFQSSTSTPASLAVGPTTIAQPVASGFGVTLSPNNAQASNFNVTFPAALPISNQVLFLDASGNLTNGRVQTSDIAGQAVTNAKIADGSIELGKLDNQSVGFPNRVTRGASSTPTAIGEILYSNSSGGFSGTFGSQTAVTNLNGGVIINAGSLVRIEIVPDNSNANSKITMSGPNTVTWALFRDGISVDMVRVDVSNGVLNTFAGLTFIDNPGSGGAHSYNLKVTSSNTIDVEGMIMIAYEI